MPSACVVNIYISPAATAPMVEVQTCRAMTGVGLAGDRYAAGSGTFSTWPKDHELTLVESETLEQLAAAGFALPAGAHRRNITTRGIALNALVDKEFTIGAVRCKGTRLCPPCTHLEQLLQRPGLVEVLRDRGGLRAIILADGEISVGDSIDGTT